MLRFCVDTVSPTIEGMGIYEKYASLVKIVEREVNVGTNDQGDTIFAKERYPVHFNVTNANCFDGLKRYKDLVPDTRKKSLGYWEPIKEMEIYDINSQFVKLSGRARLVSWFNTKKVNFFNTGTTDFTVAPIISMALIKTIHDKEFDAISPILTSANAAKVRVEYVKQETGTKELWSKYTYGTSETQLRSQLASSSVGEGSLNPAALTMWPYELMSHIFDFYLTLSAGCIADLSLGTEPVC